jgi:hypothetical protein
LLLNIFQTDFLICPTLISGGGFQKILPEISGDSGYLNSVFPFSGGFRNFQVKPLSFSHDLPAMGTCPETVGLK